VDRGLESKGRREWRVSEGIKREEKGAYRKQSSNMCKV
jgi:hypothetical protein